MKAPILLMVCWTLRAWTTDDLDLTVLLERGVPEYHLAMQPLADPSSPHMYSENKGGTRIRTTHSPITDFFLAYSARFSGKLGIEPWEQLQAVTVHAESSRRRIVQSIQSIGIRLLVRRSITYSVMLFLSDNHNVILPFW